MSIFERTDLPARMLQGSLAAVFTAVFTSLAGSLDVVHPVVTRVIVVVCSGLAGALAAVVYFYTDSIRVTGGWRKSLVNIITLLAFGAFVVAFLALAVQIPGVN